MKFAFTLATISHGGIQLILIIHHDGPMSPHHDFLDLFLQHGLCLEVIQKGVWDDTAPSSLPDLLLVAFDKPPGFIGEEGHYFGSTGRGRFDGTGGVEVR